MEKLRTVDHGTFCKGVFGPKKALGPVEYGEKNVCLLKYVVRIDERREREERRAGASGLEDTFGGKIIVKRNMTGKTNTGSDEALKRKPSSTNGVNLGVNVDNTTSSKPLFDFDRLIGVEVILVENVSSTETLPTRGPAPEINPTENNALLDSAEKVKTKVESEISPPKV